MAWSPVIRCIVVELPGVEYDFPLLPDDAEAHYRICTVCDAGHNMVTRAVAAHAYTRDKGAWIAAVIIGQGQWMMALANPDSKMPTARA